MTSNELRIFSGEIEGHQDAPCDKLVQVYVSRKESFGGDEQLMLDREITPFYRLVIGVKDSKCDQAPNNYDCDMTSNDILYPRDCRCTEAGFKFEKKNEFLKIF